MYVLVSWYVVANTPEAQFDTSRNWLIWIGFAAPLLLGLLLSICVKVIFIDHPRQPLLAICRQMHALANLQQMTTGLLVLFFLAPVIFYFSQIKSLIPYLNPTDWDTTFSEMDLWLAGGHYPYEYLSVLLNWPWLYQTLSFFYHGIWVVVCFCLIAHVSFATSESFRKSRFLLSYFLCWMIIGSICAIALNSGGPVFFHYYTNLTNYNPLVAQLRQVSGDSQTGVYGLVQLLAGYRSTTHAPPPGMGISAMPSMHVSMAFLVFLYFQNSTLVKKGLSALFAGLTYVLSIAFGWHYLVDGLVSITLTSGIWYLAGALIALQPRQFGTIVPARKLHVY